MGRYAQASRRGGVSPGVTTGSLIPQPASGVDFQVQNGGDSGTIEFDDLRGSAPPGASFAVGYWIRIRLHGVNGYSNAINIVNFADTGGFDSLTPGASYDVICAYSNADASTFGPFSAVVTINAAS